MTMTTASFVLLLLATCYWDIARGSVFLIPCDSDPCVENFTDACLTVLSTLNFVGDCCVLQDSENGEGCTLTTNGMCEQAGRIDSYVTPVYDADSSEWSMTAVAGSLGSYMPIPNATAACPMDSSDYDLTKTPSDMMEYLGMSLTGVSELSYDGIMEWARITEEHTQNISPEFDILTYIRPYVEEGETWASMVDGVLDMPWLQYLTWRVPAGSEDQDVDMPFLIEELFNSKESKAAYLASLQQANNTNLAAVTAVSDVSYPVNVTEATASPDRTESAATEAPKEQANTGEDTTTTTTDTTSSASFQSTLTLFQVLAISILLLIKA